MERYNDQVMQLYNDTNTIYWDDDDLLEIVSEQAQAYFAGGPVACGNGGTDPGPGGAVCQRKNVIHLPPHSCKTEGLTVRSLQTVSPFRRFSVSASADGRISTFLHVNIVPASLDALIPGPDPLAAAGLRFHLTLICI